MFKRRNMPRQLRRLQRGFIAMGLGRALLGRRFDIRRWWANSEAGFDWDFTDLSSMYQDSAGHSPGALEQPIGLVLDKSRLGQFGPNVWSNSVAVGSGANIAIQGDGSINVTATSASFPGVRIAAQHPTGAFVAGEVYRVEIEWSGNDEGRGFGYNVGGGTATLSTAASGSKVFYPVATATSQGVTFFLAAGAQIGDTFNVKVISVQKVLGNHLIQTTPANRFTASARYNELLRSNEFENTANWVGHGASCNVTIDGTLSPEGSLARLVASTATGQLTQSLTARTTAYKFRLLVKKGNGALPTSSFLIRNATTANNVISTALTWATMTISVVPGAKLTPLAGGWYLLELAVGAGISVGDTLIVYAGSYSSAGLTYYVGNADCRPTCYANGVLPTYQRVTTSTDYDTVGFPVRAKANSTNQWMQTAAAVDFSSTDKVTVLAAVTKLSDAAAGIVCELGAMSPGGFFIAAHDAGGREWASLARGTAAVVTGQTAWEGTPSPDSAVIATTHDIAGDLSRLRRNGVYGTNGTADKGTGNFGSYTGYVGARGGTSSFFNGDISRITARGASTVDSQIIQAERLLARRAGYAL